MRQPGLGKGSRIAKVMPGMSDESFFREVNEEIRQDRTRVLWARYGRWLIALAILAIVVTAGYVAWREYSISQANASGDEYLAALDLASAGKNDEALNALNALSDKGYGAYRDLARMRAASVLEAKGDKAGAVAAFDKVSADGNAPKPIRNMAAVRAAYILVDTGSVEDVASRVQQLSGDTEPLRFAARETMGLAAWKAGDMAEAKRLFDQLSDDQATPNGIALRTRLMLELIAAGNKPVPADALPAAGATPAEPTPATEGLDPSIVVPEMPSTPAPEAPATDATPPATETPSAPATDATPAPATSAAPGASAPTAPATPVPAAPEAVSPAPVIPAAPATPESTVPATPPAPAADAAPAPAN